MEFTKGELVAIIDPDNNKKGVTLLPAEVKAINDGTLTVGRKCENGLSKELEVSQDECFEFNTAHFLEKGERIFAPWVNQDRSLATPLYHAVVLENQVHPEIIKIKYDRVKEEYFTNSKCVVATEK